MYWLGTVGTAERVVIPFYESIYANKVQIHTRVNLPYSQHKQFILYILIRVLFFAGGDGTFLMAASKILNPSKPIVGFNTDPTRSEGHLCMPRRTAR